MAAKIRAMELLPRAFDTEYLKLYGVVFAGWALTAVGTALFFGGFPLLGGGPAAGLLGIMAGSFLWIPGAFVLFGGLVATARKVILETTNDEFVKIDRVVEGPSTAGSDGDAPGSPPSRETPVRAGSRPDASTNVGSSSRVQDPSDDDSSTAGDSNGNSSTADDSNVGSASTGDSNGISSSTGDGDADSASTGDADAGSTSEE